MGQGKVLIVNQQKRYRVQLVRLSEYEGELRRVLRIGRREWNVCFLDDRKIARLNLVYRGKNRATDVLSFPWNAVPKQTALAPASGGRRRSSESATRHPGGSASPPQAERATPQAAREFKRFLGDIVISVEAARRNAAREGHSTLNEIRWLILHGLLHLLGYDHETDDGEMNRLELALRQRLGVAGGQQRI